MYEFITNEHVQIHRYLIPQGQYPVKKMGGNKSPHDNFQYLACDSNIPSVLKKNPHYGQFCTECGSTFKVNIAPLRDIFFQKSIFILTSRLRTAMKDILQEPAALTFDVKMSHLATNLWPEVTSRYIQSQIVLSFILLRFKFWNFSFLSGVGLKDLPFMTAKKIPTLLAKSAECKFSFWLHRLSTFIQHVFFIIFLGFILSINHVLSNVFPLKTNIL